MYDSPFEPSPAVKSLQPNPRPTRILPETPQTRREATVWAAGRPPRHAPLIRNVTFGDSDYQYPLPDDADPAELDRVADCSRAAYRSALDSGRLAAILDLRPIERRCALSRAFETCARYGIGKAESVAKEHGIDTEHRQMWWMRVKQTATVDARVSCDLVPNKEALTPITSALNAAFELIKDEFIHT